jgi:glycosyltransferase involved in cell wall biosynthesis
MSTTFARFGRPRILPFCRRGGRACRRACWKLLNALLVPPDDAPALASAIEQLARDAALRRQFGKAGRRLVEEQYASDRIGPETVALYDHLLSRPLAGAAH